MTNDYLRTMILFMAVFILLACAGCTSPAPSSPVLAPSDLPGNFTVLAKGERDASQMRNWAIDHGWKRGYNTHFVKNEGNVSEGTVFEQVISVYDTDNIILVVADTVNTWKSWPAEDSNVTVEEIPLQAIGDFSRAMKTSDRSDNSHMYMIAFVKYDVFEQFQTNGTKADFETLRQMAETAADKIR